MWVSVKEFTDAGSPMVQTSTTIMLTITDDADPVPPTPSPAPPWFWRRLPARSSGALVSQVILSKQPGFLVLCGKGLWTIGIGSLQDGANTFCAMLEIEITGIGAERSPNHGLLLRKPVKTTLFKWQVQLILIVGVFLFMNLPGLPVLGCFT